MFLTKNYDYREPDYVKEDLLTIFSNYVIVKRRKSEAIKRKSLNISIEPNQISKKLKTDSVSKRKSKSKSLISEIITERDEPVAPQSHVKSEIVNIEDNECEQQDNSFIITDTDDGFHQEVHQSGQLNLECIKPIGNLHQLYEESVMKPVSLMSQRSSVAGVSSSQVSSLLFNASKEEYDHQSTFSTSIGRDQNAHSKDSDAYSSDIISNTGPVPDQSDLDDELSNHSLPCSDNNLEHAQNSKENGLKTLETEPIEKEVKNNAIPNTLTHSPSFFFSEDLDANAQKEIKAEETSLFGRDFREWNNLKRRRMNSDGHDKENCIEIIDLDMEDQRTSRAKRSRSSSLSSLSSLESIDEKRNREVLKSIPNNQKKLKVPKPIVIFKDDPRLDMERRILLSSGWLIWPVTVMSTVFKNFEMSAFQTILSQYGEENCSEINTKRDAFGLCLSQMAKNKLIFQVASKSNFFLKHPTLPLDVLDLYEISEEKYLDILWYKSSGPRNGRKLSAQLAPEVVQNLLEQELAFVKNILAPED